jgi:hypothetical protein
MGQARRGAVVIVAVVVLLLASAPARAGSTDTPVVGQCNNDTAMVLWGHPGQVVDCAGPHTGQTVWVGAWTASVSPAEANAFTVASPEDYAMRAELQPGFDACQAQMNALVGGVRSSYQVQSQLTINLVGPNDAEWAEGQRWARCDIVAAVPMTPKDVWTLRPLPAPAELVGILDKPMKSSPYRLCYWNTKNKAKYGFIDCSSRFVTQELPATYAGTAFTWPGSAKALLAKATAKCRHNPTVLSYGAKADAITASATIAKLTKANYKDQIYYCMIQV